MLLHIGVQTNVVLEVRISYMHLDSNEKEHNESLLNFKSSLMERVYGMKMYI